MSGNFRALTTWKVLEALEIISRVFSLFLPRALFPENRKKIPTISAKCLTRVLRCFVRFEIASTRLEYELTLESRERDEEREGKKKRRNIDIPGFHPRRGTSCFSQRIFICFSKSLPKLTPNVRKGTSSCSISSYTSTPTQRTFRPDHSRDATIYLHMLFPSGETTLSHNILSVQRGLASSRTPSPRIIDSSTRGE